MRIETFAGGDFGENTYVVVAPDAPLAWVIDPGAEAPAVVDFLEREGLRLGAILLTHAHLDHVEGIPALRRWAPGAPIYLHPGDLRLYQGVDLQARAFHLPLVGPLPEPDRSLEEGQRLQLGSILCEVRWAPGHAPGHVLFFFPTEGVAFVGDVIFRGSIGRTDLVGGDFQRLMESIRQQVLTLPDETRLLSGHGPQTTVGWERRTNPFLVGHFGGELV